MQDGKIRLTGRAVIDAAEDGMPFCLRNGNGKELNPEELCDELGRRLGVIPQLFVGDPPFGEEAVNVEVLSVGVEGIHQAHLSYSF